MIKLGKPYLMIWNRILPIMFVILWSTGFIGSKLGAPYSEPFTFLAIRFSIASAIIVSVGLCIKMSWPKTSSQVMHTIIAGILIHGIYLGGVFWAIDDGLTAGLTALIIALQPILMSIGAALFLEENITSKHWIGLSLGLAGVTIVIKETMGINFNHNMLDSKGIIACIISVIALSIGSLYQKRFCSSENVWAHQAIQLSSAAVFLISLSFIFETQNISWSTEFIVAFG